jgi:hypothetical protein
MSCDRKTILKKMLHIAKVIISVLGCLLGIVGTTYFSMMAMNVVLDFYTGLQKISNVGFLNSPVIIPLVLFYPLFFLLIHRFTYNNVKALDLRRPVNMILLGSQLVSFMAVVTIPMLILWNKMYALENSLGNQYCKQNILLVIATGIVLAIAVGLTAYIESMNNKKNQRIRNDTFDTIDEFESRIKKLEKSS